LTFEDHLVIAYILSTKFKNRKCL